MRRWWPGIVTAGLVACGAEGEPTADATGSTGEAASTTGEDDSAPAPPDDTTGDPAGDSTTGPAAVDVSCLDAPLGAVGGNYEHAFVTVRAEAAVTLEAVMPPGLELDADGFARGKPTIAGIYDVEVTAVADDGGTATATCPVTIHAALAIDPSIDPLGGDYCVPLGASLLDRLDPGTGDGTPVECVFEPGALEGRVPIGLEIDPDTCVAEGEVLDPLYGSFAFIVQGRQNGARVYVPYCAGQPVSDAPLTIDVTHDGVSDPTRATVRLFAPDVPLGLYELGKPRIHVTGSEPCSPGGCIYAFSVIPPPAGFTVRTFDPVNLANIHDPSGVPIGISHDIFLTGPPAPSGVADRPWVYQLAIRYCLGASVATCAPEPQYGGRVELAFVMVPT